MRLSGSSSEEMPSHYPEVIEQENRRARLFIGAVMVCLFAPFLLLLAFANDWSNFGGGIALGIILAVVAGKLVKRFVRVRCPQCSGVLQEDYYGGKGSRHVAHTCTACGARYDNGTLKPIN